MRKKDFQERRLFGVCPYVTTQEVLSGKWAILILHHLSGGPMRFNQLQKEMGITQATLAAQLKNLEHEGIISRTAYPEVPPRVEYALTEIGERFQPVLDSIEVWGTQYIDFLKRRDD